MSVETLAAKRYREAVHLQRTTTRAASALWKRMNPRGNIDAEWLRIAPLILEYVTQAQRQAAEGAESYVEATVAAQGIQAPSSGDVNASAFSGVASDGRRLDSLLYSPVTTARAAWVGGASTAEGLRSGLFALQMIVSTQVADAGRVADGVAIASRPKLTGYVRMLSPPSCARCAILAGRFYRWSSGFARHPRCDCRHIPASEDTADDLRTDPMRAYREGQVTGLSEGERQALDNGADFSRVVNARRGTYVAGGKSYTRELRAPRRLTPEQILRDATSREDAIRLLRRFGFIF